MQKKPWSGAGLHVGDALRDYSPMLRPEPGLEVLGKLLCWPFLEERCAKSGRRVGYSGNGKYRDAGEEAAPCQQCRPGTQCRGSPTGRHRLAGSPPRLQQHYVGTTMYLAGAGPQTWAVP